jgi:lantibiotic modifying enzyme
MCRHTFTRREMLGMGLGAAAGMMAIPRALSAVAAQPVSPPSPLRAPVNELDVALKAARWIRRARVETKNGVTWPADPLTPNSVQFDLYNGMPGVILFHIELFDATGDRSWLDDAKLGANELAAQLPALQAAQSAGFYEGLAGAAFVLEETHRVTGEGRYRDAARQAIGMIHQLAAKSASGAHWSGPSATNDVISGTAGIGLFLLWADETIGDPASRALALAAGRHLLDVGMPEAGGTKWAVGQGVTKLYPNFSHGTAGVGFFLAKLFAATSDTSMYAGALGAARYLDAVAVKQRNGFKVFHDEPDGRDLFYLSWCHGPAGTSRLFAQLAQIARPAKWNALVDECATAMIDAGVPETQSPGYWNNISQCCGNAGVGEFFIARQRAAPRAAYAAMVQRVSANTLARATAEGDGLKWVQAENRVSPQAVVAQTGYMQGAAGVGTYFLHADALAKGRTPLVRWPDAPSTGECTKASTQSTLDMSHLAGGKRRVC